MKLRIIACALLTTGLGAGLAGCGGDSGTGARIDTRTQARLQEILSRNLRLPDGFTARPQEPWRVPFTARDKRCKALLAVAGGKVPKEALTAQAAVSYPGHGVGETAGVALATYAGAGAETHLDDLGADLAACQKVAVGGGTRLKLRTTPVKEVGDEAVGGRLRGRLNGFPYALNVLFVRDGDTLLSLVHTGVSPVDLKRTEQLARSVLSRAQEGQGLT
ncbi:hypothetical protein [Nonomuraea longicatena]|uniref:Lipoprotein n=1 Tax=Nonomuraea longicatena TaxID=83682 RepID=A0ABN1PJV7_9ACTN